MKAFADFIPVVLFLVALLLFDMYVATGVMMVATVAVAAWVKLRGEKISPVLWLTLGTVLVFGSLTLILHDKMFIKWKPTIVNWVLALTVFVGQTAFGKNVIRMLMSKEIDLPDAVWNKLGLAWAVFFAVIGALNLYVAYNYSDVVWGYFKFIGVLGLTFVFVIVQSIFLAKHIQHSPSEKNT